MRIVVDAALTTASAEYSNMGNVVMLQVGVSRLQRLWPSARIEVLTDSPTNLALFCPGAEPLPRAGRDLWIGEHAISGGFARGVSRVKPLALPLAHAGFKGEIRLHTLEDQTTFTGHGLQVCR